MCNLSKCGFVLPQSADFRIGPDQTKFLVKFSLERLGLLNAESLYAVDKYGK